MIAKRPYHKRIVNHFSIDGSTRQAGANDQTSVAIARGYGAGALQIHW
jgi:hypothetical protein